MTPQKQGSNFEKENVKVWNDWSPIEYRFEKKSLIHGNCDDIICTINLPFVIECKHYQKCSHRPIGLFTPRFLRKRNKISTFWKQSVIKYAVEQRKQGLLISKGKEKISFLSSKHRFVDAEAKGLKLHAVEPNFSLYIYDFESLRKYVTFEEFLLKFEL